MIVNGIVAEYNPFHNGHKYQLEESRRLTGADYTVIVLSGNFVQRGTPALINKHLRTEMALKNGADLVIELPAIYATSSAEFFAMGAVSLLDQLKVVTNLCFGSECGDISLLNRIATILVQEPDDFSAKLKQLLCQGYSYPSARSEALMHYMPSLADSNNIFRSPNNILGIEYLKALLRRKSSIAPVTVRRIGADYHDPLPGSTGYCSALAIRQSVWAGDDITGLRSYVPANAYELLAAQKTDGKFIRSADLSTILYYKLLSEKEYGFEKYLDVSKALSDRIVNSLNSYQGFESFCDVLKTKEMTYARISRCLLHILLGLTRTNLHDCTRLGYTPYARVLGFRRDAAPLLSAIKEKTSIPLITKAADAEKILDADAALMFRQDMEISQLYHGISGVLTGSVPLNEYCIPLVIV